MLSWLSSASSKSASLKFPKVRQSGIKAASFFVLSKEVLNSSKEGLREKEFRPLQVLSKYRINLIHKIKKADSMTMDGDRKVISRQPKAPILIVLKRHSRVILRQPQQQVDSSNMSVTS